MPGTRIFSPLAVAGLCVTIGRYWYPFKRLTALSAGRFYRFEHIVSYSSGKVVAKSVDPARANLLNAIIPDLSRASHSWKKYGRSGPPVESRASRLPSAWAMGSSGGGWLCEWRLPDGC